MTKSHAYVCGWRAFLDGRNCADNPYPQGTSDYRAWLVGWQAADASYA